MADHHYHVSGVNHLISNLKGGGFCAKIYLAQACLQFPVDEKSAGAQTIITHKGAFRVKRLQFGIKVVPGIFQNLIANLFQNMEGIVPYFEDLWVMANLTEELASRLEKVLAILKEYGLKANRDKCVFGVQENDFLGFWIDKKEIHPSKSKVIAIQEFPVPEN